MSATGGMALTPHPTALGSALTHPDITTDYSEALIEFITPPLPGVGDALDYLADLQAYVYRRLDNEILWATSMPCVLSGDQNIPVARYGTSNAGRMKHVYRVGLGNRYGRVMQVIAGVHFNWSFADDLWPAYRLIEGRVCGLRDFRDQRYMAQIRNLQRYRLADSLPVRCLAGRVQVVLPREGDQSAVVRRDDLLRTARHLAAHGRHRLPEQPRGRPGHQGLLRRRAVLCRQPAEGDHGSRRAPGRRIGVRDGDDYRQLNANILQIENEYYSTVRPKQVLEGLEKPSLALKKRGIRYIELRSLDVNAYHPLGLDETQGRFLEVFLLFCLFADSPLIDDCERREIDRNLLDVAHRGREPRLVLQHRGVRLPMRAWALEILESMLPVCEMLDAYRGWRLVRGCDGRSDRQGACRRN